MFSISKCLAMPAMIAFSMVGGSPVKAEGAPLTAQFGSGAKSSIGGVHEDRARINSRQDESDQLERERRSESQRIMQRECGPTACTAK